MRKFVHFSMQINKTSISMKNKIKIQCFENKTDNHIRFKHPSYAERKTISLYEHSRRRFILASLHFNCAAATDATRNRDSEKLQKWVVSGENFFTSHSCVFGLCPRGVRGSESCHNYPHLPCPARH